MMGEAHVMKERQYQLISELPCEEQLRLLLEILGLYSDYMVESYSLREIISEKIDKIIISDNS